MKASENISNESVGQKKTYSESRNKSPTEENRVRNDQAQEFQSHVMNSAGKRPKPEWMEETGAQELTDEHNTTPNTRRKRQTKTYTQERRSPPKTTPNSAQIKR